MKRTTGALLAATAEKFPSKVAICHGGERLSYRDLDRQANRLANALIDRGLSPGARIALMCRNSIDYSVAYFGAAKGGLVSAHLSWRYTAAELAHALNRIDCSALLVDEEFLPVFEAASGQLARKPLTITRRTAPGSRPTLVGLIAETSDTAPATDVVETDPGTILFTSGTTGMPKAALASHKARFIGAQVAVESFGLGERDVQLVASPLYHAAGLFAWYQPSVLAGATCIFLSDWSIPAFIEAVHTHSVTGAFMVPAQIAMLLQHPSFDADRLASLRLIVYGGASATPGLIEAAEAKLPNVRFLLNFGSTETGPLLTATPEDRRKLRDTLGRPTRHTDVAVQATNGGPVATGEVGELTTRGDHLISEYVGDAEATAAFFRVGGGWGWMGDLVVEDHQTGMVRLVGRSKDTIVAGGVKIYPGEIERILLQHEDVTSCAAFGVGDYTWGELPAAEVTLKAGSHVSAQELIDFCASHIARFKRPRLIRIVDSLPMTAAGKLDRKALKARNADLKVENEG